jgi:hypothetical protein
MALAASIPAASTALVPLPMRLKACGLQRVLCNLRLGFCYNEEADREKHRINLSDIGRGEKIEGSDGIPKDLLGLIDRSMRLLDRVQVLDTMIAQANSNEAPAVASPVSEQLDRLARAFGGR